MCLDVGNVDHGETLKQNSKHCEGGYQGIKSSILLAKKLYILSIGLLYNGCFLWQTLHKWPVMYRIQ